MTKKALRTQPGALALIDQSIHLLRRNNLTALAEYYIGALPFVLGVLFFWSDMSGNPMAQWYCGPSAAGVALLFIWMKLWQVRFCRRLWCHLQQTEPELWNWKRTVATAARQTALHATGVIILPIAFIILFPFGWVYAFYQNLCALDSARTKGMHALAKTAKEQAALWPGQNHILLMVMNFFGLFVFLNLGVGLAFIPYLLKSILGIETVFTLSGMRLFNTTYLAVLGGLTYLCVDPILKCMYVLRCFYGYSRQTGDDLKSALRPFLTVAASLAILAVLTLSSPAVWANNQVYSNDLPKALSSQNYADQLDDQIESVLEQRRFAWRLPREVIPEPPEDSGWFSATLKWVGEKFKGLLKTIGNWIGDFFDWLENKMPEPKNSQSTGTGDYRGLIRLIFYALAFGLGFWLLFLLVRWFKSSRPVSSGPAAPDTGVGDVDLNDESITAKDLPLDRWLAIARDMMDKKDFQRALRALYLSVLAQLADHERVKIARYKSNREYARELARRAHAEPELLTTFDWCIRIFERSWYGMHPVDRQQLDKFFERQKRIAALVQPTA